MYQNVKRTACRSRSRRRRPWSVGSLSTRVLETRTATGKEHFACEDSGVSQIFILIISNGEKIFSNVNVVVLRQVKKGKQITFGCRPRLKNARA